MSVTVDPSVYTDLQGLAKLRGQAHQNSPEALREAAKQFEAMFVQMMLKSMREAKLGDGLMDNDQSNMYSEMYDKQLSMDLTRQHSLGLAGMLMKQLGGDKAAASAVDGALPAAPGILPLNGQSRALQAVQSQRLNAEALGTLDASVDSSELPNLAGPDAPKLCGASEDLSTPQNFVQTLWPQAQQAARELGVNPKVLVAQAALETGWGRSVMQHPDGRSSHNLFGIKASPGWDGSQVSARTLEYDNGIPVRTRAAFRSYGSYADSFSDYVDFLKSNPRYRQALAQAGNPQQFASALQNAGYATDPAYAQKISAIVNGDTLQGALAPLQQAAAITQIKLSDAGPLS